MKKILILSANPKPTSFTLALAETYAQTAKVHNKVKLLDLSNMQFSIDLTHGYDQVMALEDDLKQFQELLNWCDHFVIFTPVWWGGVPAKLKGLFDRTLLPGFAFEYVKGNAFPKQLLKNKSAHVFLLMDTPPWYYRLIQRSPAVKELNQPILKFIGLKPVRFTMFGPVINSTNTQRQKWIQSATSIASKYY